MQGLFIALTNLSIAEGIIAGVSQPDGSHIVAASGCGDHIKLTVRDADGQEHRAILRVEAMAENPAPPLSSPAPPAEVATPAAADAINSLPETACSCDKAEEGTEDPPLDTCDDECDHCDASQPCAVEESDKSEAPECAGDDPATQPPSTLPA